MRQHAMLVCVYASAYAHDGIGKVNRVATPMLLQLFVTKGICKRASGWGHFILVQKLVMNLKPWSCNWNCLRWRHANALKVSWNVARKMCVGKAVCLREIRVCVSVLPYQWKWKLHVARNSHELIVLWINVHTSGERVERWWVEIKVKAFAHKKATSFSFICKRM